ncbi:hypothetical protein [Mycolicibacterium parafortuitum]|uniref:Uncharacterized protein n=1 Tax=Mycolicibacterium parafortuitum TaxID=39692 RepID=A0ACC6MLE1_MYCPF|nr:hypothetical protein [Mycolicibacterium parafortuitum]MDZ5087827.1 hypothetical protein [Mycolicibacterium parafortuitum]
MKFEFVAKTLSVLGGAAVVGLLAAAPALADPAPAPAPPPAPLYAEAAGPVPGPAPDAVVPAPGAVSPAPDAVSAAAGPAGAPAVSVAAPAQAPAESVPHLASPENLPPGTSTTPPASTSRLGYLRDLWHAMQTQEVSGSDALLLLTQRPMTSTPKPGMSAGPQSAPPAPAPAVAPAQAPPPAPVVPQPVVP